MHYLLKGIKVDDAIGDISDFDSSWSPIQRLIEHSAAFAGVLPPCVLSKNYECYGCIADELEECPVQSDPDYRSYLLFLRDSFVEHERKRVAQIKLLQNVLRRHKLPLHWEYIALLAMKEAPELFASPQSVRGLVFFNPDIFVMVREGVFILRKY